MTRDPFEDVVQSILRKALGTNSADDAIRDMQYKADVGASIREYGIESAREAIEDFKTRVGREPSEEFSYMAGRVGVLFAMVDMLMRPDVWREKVKRTEAPR